jgi:hypothetical protein
LLGTAQRRLINRVLLLIFRCHECREHPQVLV